MKSKRWRDRAKYLMYSSSVIPSLHPIFNVRSTSYSHLKSTKAFFFIDREENLNKNMVAEYLQFILITHRSFVFIVIIFKNDPSSCKRNKFLISLETIILDIRRTGRTWAITLVASLIKLNLFKLSHYSSFTFESV